MVGQVEMWKYLLSASLKFVVDHDLLVNKGTSSGIGYFQSLEYWFHSLVQSFFFFLIHNPYKD